jgi:6-hydroxytryprostatin B O-methyltransferase
MQVGSTSAYPSILLAKTFPLLSFELQPQPRATADIKTTLNTLAPVLASRITISTQSMFAPQSRTVDTAVSKQVVFLLRHVLHNLLDPIARSVLANIALVLEPSGRIVIMDLVLPQVGEVDPYQEGMLRMRDLIQREMANGRTRDETDWNELIGNVGQGLRVMGTVTPAGSDLSVLEVGIKSTSS